MKNLVQSKNWSGWTKIGTKIGLPKGLYVRAAFTSIVEAQLATDDISKV